MAVGREDIPALFFLGLSRFRVSEKPLVAEARLPGISLSGNHLVNKDKKKGWSPDMEPRPMFSYQPSPNRGLRRCHVVSSYFSEPPQAAPGW